MSGFRLHHRTAPTPLYFRSGRASRPDFQFALTRDTGRGIGSTAWCLWRYG